MLYNLLIACWCSQTSIQTLELKEDEGSKEGEKLRGEIQQLRDKNHQLSSQVELLEQQSAETAQALQQQPVGVSPEEVEVMKAQLQEAHAKERKALVEELQTERSAEVTRLRAQYEAELHSMKEELSRALRTWEEEKSSAEKQLASETAEKRVRKGCKDSCSCYGQLSPCCFLSGHASQCHLCMICGLLIIVTLAQLMRCDEIHLCVCVRV